MCTVSFISHNNKVFITSNRDEHISRPLAFAPQKEIINNIEIIYPKDPKAGGTWFATNGNGWVAVLLNGAFEKHIRKEFYAKSRGVILLEIISKKNPLVYFELIEIIEIEPFTLILYHQNKLTECRWDGEQKHIQYLNTSQNYIWSSATLYEKQIIANRENMFYEFLQHTETISEESITNFHSNKSDFENGFVINRNNQMKTFSISQAVVTISEIRLKHNDLLEKVEHNDKLTISNIHSNSHV